jgi:chloramphenicol-sensitive protein RarD
MSDPARTDRDHRASGLASAIVAYGLWGLLPLYFKALHGVGALEILAHRIAGSAILLAAGLAIARGRAGFTRLRAGRPRVLLATTALIAGNWLLYIWAVQSRHVLDASLGYYVNPLVNVALGVGFLGERLRPRQKAAFALAGLGVAALVLSTGRLPWIALVLAATFGLYGLLRKRADVEPVGGLLAETALLSPAALGLVAWLALRGEGAFGRTAAETALLALAGAITSVPLLAFGHAIRRLRLSTMGIVQYLAPTGQLLLAVLAFGEPFGRAHAFTFACIWSALALYTWDAIAAARAADPV